jgi:hypothetical protein
LWNVIYPQCIQILSGIAPAQWHEKTFIMDQLTLIEEGKLYRLVMPSKKTLRFKAEGGFILLI